MGKYMRTIYQAKFNQDFEIGTLVEAEVVTVAGPFPSFLLASVTDVILYAWLSPQEFEHFGSVTGAASLEHWISGLTIDAEVVARLGRSVWAEQQASASSYFAI